MLQEYSCRINKLFFLGCQPEHFNKRLHVVDAEKPIFKHNQTFMKQILISAFFFPLFAVSQDPVATRCKLNKETDPYTKETKLSTGFIFLRGGSVTIDADSKEIDVLFSIEGADKCFDNNSTAIIHFEGSKVKTSLRNGGTMNCEGLFHFIFKNSVNPIAALKKITTQKITHIIFTGNNKKESVVTIRPEEQQTLLTLAGCLVNDAKALIK